jgi:hypothetical protein
MAWIWTIYEDRKPWNIMGSYKKPTSAPIGLDQKTKEGYIRKNNPELPI